MIVSNETYGNPPVSQMAISSNGVTEQHIARPITSASVVYPRQQNSERIDHRNFTMPSAAIRTTSREPNTNEQYRSDRSTSNVESVPSNTLQQQVSHTDNETGLAVISQHELPPYVRAYSSDSIVPPSGHPSPSSEMAPYLSDTTIPDILYSHMIPRHPASMPTQHRHQRGRSRHEESTNRGSRHHQHRVHSDRSDRHRRRSSWSRSSTTQVHEGTCKEPCVKCMVTVTSFRWVLVVLSVLGVCCVVTGIVLASLHAAGQSFLFLAIMFIGLGVLLVIVVGVGWKCTPRGHEPLHALFGIGGFMQGRSRRRRHRRHRNRDRNWAGGMMYPEFQFRRPPPTYAVSMQDYHNHVLPATNEQTRSSIPSDRISPPSSPPPSYRSRTSTYHSGILTAFQNITSEGEPSSRPPTYRSRASSHRPSFPNEYRFNSSDPEAELEDSHSPEPYYTETSRGNISTNAYQSEIGIPSLQTHLQIASTSLPAETTTRPTSIHQQKHFKSEVQISSIDERNQINNQSSSNTLPNTQNNISDALPSASASALENQSSVRQPSMLQRMDTEDRLLLEETLHSLDHIDDSLGITNNGASFDDLTQ